MRLWTAFCWLWTKFNELYGIRTCALIVTIQEYTYNCTILQYKDFTIEKLKL